MRVLQREITQSCRKRGNKQTNKVTSQPALCGLVRQGTGLQVGASGWQRGGEEGMHPLHAQSRAATAALKDRVTPPSCDRPTEGGKPITIYLHRPSVGKDGVFITGSVASVNPQSSIA